MWWLSEFSPIIVVMTVRPRKTGSSVKEREFGDCRGEFARNGRLIRGY
jgi:hypothetical protein